MPEVGNHVLVAARERAPVASRGEPGRISGNPRYPLIYDPQTAGGLLAAVDKDKAEACVAALRGAGYPTTCVIGETFAHLPAVASAPEQVVYVQDAAHRFASTGEATVSCNR